jgi:DNA-binding CsgD family transcriptional regulator
MTNGTSPLIAYASDADMPLATAVVMTCVARLRLASRALHLRFLPEHQRKMGHALVFVPDSASWSEAQARALPGSIVAGALDSNALLISALAHGAAAVVNVRMPFEDFVAEVHDAISNPSPDAASARTLRRRVEERVREYDLVRELTNREFDVLEKVCGGWTAQHIAAKFGISLATTRTHIQHLLQKLGVQSQAQARTLLTRSGDDQRTRLMNRRQLRF